MTLPTLLVPLAFALTIPLSPGVRAVLESHSPDSLLAPLKRHEVVKGKAPEAGEAAFLLGQLHLARGEHRLAADAFSRAAARLDGARKAEARYWAGVSWLGVPDGAQARAVLDEVSGARKPEAQLGIAIAWEQQGRPDKAYETLYNLLRGDPGEAGPAALERIATLADQLHKPDVASRALSRLQRDYPGSFEAVGAFARAP
jgi:TolA-binding protein